MQTANRRPSVARGALCRHGSRLSRRRGRRATARSRIAFSFRREIRVAGRAVAASYPAEYPRRGPRRRRDPPADDPRRGPRRRRRLVSANDLRRGPRRRRDLSRRVSRRRRGGRLDAAAGYLQLYLSTHAAAQTRSRPQATIRRIVNAKGDGAIDDPEASFPRARRGRSRAAGQAPMLYPAPEDQRDDQATRSGRRADDASGRAVEPSGWRRRRRRPRRRPRWQSRQRRPRRRPRRRRPRRRPTSCRKTQVADMDAQIANEAMKGGVTGLGCDHPKLISVLCTRTKAALARTRVSYRSTYDKDFAVEVKSETSSNYGNMMAFALATPEEYVLSPRGSTDGSRRRRGCDVDIPWRRVAATPRPGFLRRRRTDAVLLSPRVAATRRDAGRGYHTRVVRRLGLRRGGAHRTLPHAVDGAAPRGQEGTPRRGDSVETSRRGADVRKRLARFSGLGGPERQVPDGLHRQEPRPLARRPARGSLESGGSRQRRGCHVDRPQTGRGNAPDATWIIRGRVAAAPRGASALGRTRPQRPRCGSSERGRTRRRRGRDASRRRHGRDADRP